jgi:YcxB-like protein
MVPTPERRSARVVGGLSDPENLGHKDVVSIRFEVRYRLAEYVAFATDDARSTDAFVRDAARWKQRIFAGALGVLAVGAFVWKSHRIGRCTFKIDAHGIERTSKRGTSSVPWSRVQAVRVYRRGYVVELSQGAVPVPFRVLTQEAQRAFEHLAGPLLRSGQR